jgi:endonuclease/exonuclease/phosphatase family metal-dependent hydrolase
MLRRLMFWLPQRIACAAVLAASLGACRPGDDYAGSGRADAAGDAAGAVGTDRSDPAVLRAATFNTHLFFDPTCDSGRCAAGDFEQAPTPQAFAGKAAALAQAVRAFGADVVALQEVESQTSLEALAAHLTDLYPTVVLGETGQPGSIDVAVLGAGTLLEVRRHRDLPLVRPDGTATYFARELLEVHMQVKGRHVALFAAHFRSKVSDDPGRRLAEAQAARLLVLGTAHEFPDAVVLLGGDLNDTPGSPPLAALEAAPELLRVARDRPLANIATYTWNGQLQAIDHLFLALSASVAYVPASAAAVHDASGRWGPAGSDHAALRADIRIH